VPRQHSRLGKAQRALRGFLPEPLAEVRGSLRRAGVEGTAGLYSVWLVIWLCRIATTLGSLMATVKAQGKGRRNYATQ
jgi:hypothetical protein